MQLEENQLEDRVMDMWGIFLLIMAAVIAAIRQYTSGTVGWGWTAFIVILCALGLGCILASHRRDKRFPDSKK